MQVEKKIRKKAVFYGFAAILLVAVIGTLSYELGVYRQGFPPPAPPIPVPPSALLARFSSRDAIRDFLETSSGTQGFFSYYGPSDSKFLSPMIEGFNTRDSAGLAIQYSPTNVQVTGVDEADTVKTDGRYIYVLSGSTVSILKAYPPETAAILSKITFNDLYPVGIFVNGDRLAVLGSKYSVSSRSYYVPYSVDIKTFVNIYDIHDKSNPVLLRDLIVSGSYFNSRMIGDYVYYVVSQPAYVIYDTVILPKFYSNGQAREIAASDIYYSEGNDSYYQFTTFAAVNIYNMTQTPTYLTMMLGGTSSMYVSLENIYVTFPEHYDETSIYRVRMEAENMTCEAKGKVSGHVLNQFSMDEYDSNFRIVTQTWSETTQTNLYILDANLSIIGRLENLAPGENLHSARLMGKRGYLVTFMKTDPLFVIDLSEPTNPSVLGQLKIPGYSDYLHPYDETHLIGVGKETAESDSAYFAWYQGIKISLFDVSNVTNPAQMDKYIIGDRGSDSPILSDHKAFLFDKTKNLLVIPVSVAKVDESQYPYGVPTSAYGQTVWQGAYVFGLSLENGFVLRGNITHIDNAGNLWDNSYWVKRSLYIENVLYTISDKRVQMNSLADLTLLDKIELP